MSSTSSSSGTSTSTSSPVPYEGPESALLMEFAKYARSLAPEMLTWAKQAYNSNNELTDQLLNQANIYASPARIAQDMGAAQSHVMQGAEAGRQSAIKDLQSYGVDPSSGRYAALDMAERTRAGAAAAGAGNMQREATEAKGRQMRDQAMKDKLANSQFGANAMRIPNDYLQTAMGLKFPPMGQKTDSKSQQNSQGNSANPDSGGGQRSPSGGGGGGPLGGGGSPSWGGSGRGAAPGGGAYNGSPSSSGYRGGNGGGGAGMIDVPGGGGGSDNGYYDPGGEQNSYDQPYDSQYYDPYSAYDPGGDTWGTQDYTSPNGGWDQQYQNGGDYQQGTYDYSWPDSGGGGGGSDPVYGGADGGDSSTSGSWADSANYDSGGGWDGSWDYAQGGDVQGQGGIPDDPTTGGFVSPELSPSGGDQTDDVDANLNAGEFVIPKDVAAWKGQEFFQNLILKSRQARSGAPAKPAMR